MEQSMYDCRTFQNALDLAYEIAQYRKSEVIILKLTNDPAGYQYRVTQRLTSQDTIAAVVAPDGTIREGHA